MVNPEQNLAMKNINIFIPKFILLMNMLLLCISCAYQHIPGRVNLYDKNNLKQGIWIEINSEGDEDRIFISHYKNNLLNGPFREFYMEGNLRGKGRYKNGNRIGKWEFYLPEGDLILWKTYDKNGNELGVGRANPIW